MALKLNSRFWCCFFVLLFLVADCSSSSSSLSDSIFENRGSDGPARTLLQIKKSCPIDFEFQNYTIIISQCKGPQFPANSCCMAFKEFACPYAAELNDVTNDCATIMFSYIRIYGNYPPGLFANECRDTKQGLDCTTVNVPPASSSKETATSNSPGRATTQKSFILAAGCLLVLLIHP